VSSNWELFSQVEYKFQGYSELSLSELQNRYGYELPNKSNHTKLLNAAPQLKL